MHILLIEDNPGDQVLFRAALADNPANGATLECASLLDEGLVRLRGGGIDIVVLDLSLPDSHGLDTVTRVHAVAPALPIVVLTGTLDAELGVAAMRRGAHDYLIKGELGGSVLLRSLRYAMERQRQQQALLRVQEGFRRVIEKAPDGIAVLRAGRLVYANPAFVAALGYSAPEDLIGQKALSLIVPEERHDAADRMRRAEESDRALPAEERRLLRKNGSQAVLEISPGPVIEFEGEPALLWMARDVTERKAIEARLLLSDRLASVGMLAAGVAHEINNPLAYVIANLGLIAEDLPLLEAAVARGQGRLTAGNGESAMGLDPVGRIRALQPMIGKSRAGLERVRLIVRDLRTFSRVDQAKTGPLDVRQVLKSAIQMVNNEIRHHAQLVEHYGEVPLVEASDARLGQVFLNLLVNAAQAIPEGAADRHEIRVSCFTDGDSRAVVEVHDTGHGIPAEIIDHIFDPFFTTKEVGAGTGLGLSICHSLVTALGGKIVIESTVGAGSTFRVVLPAAQRPAADPRPAPAARRATQHGRILIVDDEPDIGETLQMVLSPTHEAVVAVTRGRDALERLTAGERYDVILCDLMMPVMTGMDLHAELERMLPDQAARMIFFTGGAFTPRARAFLEGRGVYVEKPFDLTKLRQLIDERIVAGGYCRGSIPSSTS
jgi:PAS domain S-box-containing protein